MRVSPYTLHQAGVVQQENQRRNDYRNMKFQPITPEKDPGPKAQVGAPRESTPQKQPPDKEERVRSPVPGHWEVGLALVKTLERKPALATNQDGKGEEKKQKKCINKRRDNRGTNST